MRILDRYILSSVGMAFLFGLAMFLALLMAMDILGDLIKMIAELGVPARIALAIFGYRVPAMLVYAFPMSVLLSILLVFNRMSSDSEMVAIRAGGISFVRVVIPALAFAVGVTGATFAISNAFVPFATSRAERLSGLAFREAKSAQPLAILHMENGERRYALVADFDADAQTLDRLDMTIYRHGRPAVLIHAERARWDPRAQRWRFIGASVEGVGEQTPPFLFIPTSKGSSFDVESTALLLKENPLDLTVSKEPQNLTVEQLRAYIAHLQELGITGRGLNEWRLGLAQRFAVPFTSLIFALIGAPLGLRHHRTSSAMGLGMSIIIIFVYYTLFHYMALFSMRGGVSPALAAWSPNVVGGILGLLLLARANR